MITEQQIWDYLDGHLTATERTAFELALQHDGQAAKLLGEIKSLHSMLKAQPAPYPASGFTDRVMAALPAVTAKPQALVFPYKLVVLAALPVVLVAAVFIAFIIYTSAPLNYTLPYQLPSVDFSSYYTLFLFADIILAVLFIDELPEIRSALFSK
jgi:anti-sigma factor RsiW